MTISPINYPKINNFTGMNFGEMIDNNFIIKDWTTLVTGLSQNALYFYKSIIENRLIENTFNLYPADDNANNFNRMLSSEIAKAVSNQAPTLSMLVVPSVMPDGTTGDKGVMNLQENGTEGRRSADFLSEFPQSMLEGNIADYGSSGKSSSVKDTKYKASLNAIKDLTDPDNPYQDTINKIVDEVTVSGIFSNFIY